MNQSRDSIPETRVEVVHRRVCVLECVVQCGSRQHVWIAHARRNQIADNTNRMVNVRRHVCIFSALSGVLGCRKSERVENNVHIVHC